MRSMTGYGTSKGQGVSISLEVSLKAVNGRFFDLKSHIPKEYAHLESTLKKMILKKIQRGTVDLYISRRVFEDSQKVVIRGNNQKAKKWVKAIGSLSQELNIDFNIDLFKLIEMGGLIDEVKEIAVTDSEEKKLLKVFREALSFCDEERGREGVALRQELQGHLKKLLSFTEQMGKMRENANKELKTKVRKRLESFELNKKEWEPRWAMEIALMADRSDIDEEMSRLREHIGSILKLVESDKGPHGKKLDFYCQELLRETNTIGSKSQIARLTHMVVEAKSVIEKLREQVQNVE